MNSGETRESKHHIAVLEEEDVETFTAFCEYAYTGDYVVPPPGQREDEKEQVVHNPFKGFLRGERDAMDAAKMAGSGAGMGTGVESVGSPAVSAEGFQGFQGWNGFLPPPAPSPPPPAGGYGPGPGPGYGYGYGDGDGDGVNGLGLNAKSWEEMRSEVKVPEQAIDDDDDIEPFPAMPVAPETAEKAPEEVKPVEQPKPEQPESKQPEPEQPARPAQPEPEDAPEGKSKKGKKNKKDKKKKGNAEEVPELTPPTTLPAKHAENPAESVGEPGPEVAEDGGQGAAAEPTLAVETAGQMESKPESNQEKEEKEEKKQDKPEPQEEQQQEEKQQAPPVPPQQQQQQQQKQKQDAFPLFTPRDQKIDMWDEFMTLAYVDQRPTYPTPRSKVAKACTPDDLPYLTFHAKVYVFATRYLIPALAQLSLQKLHRDLLYLAFPVDPDFSSAGAAGAAAGGQSSIHARAEEEEGQKTKARMVLDLLYYTYSKTTRVELTIVPGSDLEREEEEGQEYQRPSELRKLVVHYAACKVRDLAMYGPVVNTPSGTNHDRKPSSRGLRGLLDTMSELASDLVFRMM